MNDDRSTDMTIDTWAGEFSVAPARGTSVDGLTSRQRQLRDGEDFGPSAHTTTRRQAGNVALAEQHAEVLRVIGELETYRAHALTAECDPLVVAEMDRINERTIAKVKARADGLYRSLQQRGAR